MTNASTLETKLAEWCREYANIGGESDRLPGFLARRIVEAGLTTVTEDPDVIRITINGKTRKRRITGWDSGIMKLQFEEIEPGYLGFGLCPVEAVPADEHPRLAEIMDRLKKSGR